MYTRDRIEYLKRVIAESPVDVFDDIKRSVGLLRQIDPTNDLLGHYDSNNGDKPRILLSHGFDRQFRRSADNGSVLSLTRYSEALDEAIDERNRI